MNDPVIDYFNNISNYDEYGSSGSDSESTTYNEEQEEEARIKEEKKKEARRLSMKKYMLKKKSDHDFMEKRREYSRQYNENNREYINKKSREAQILRYANNPESRKKDNLYRRMSYYVKNYNMDEKEAMAHVNNLIELKRKCKSN
jgi:hypothetical protein